MVGLTSCAQICREARERARTCARTAQSRSRGSCSASRTFAPGAATCGRTVARACHLGATRTREGSLLIRVWSRALPDHGIERIAEHTARAAVEAAPVSCFSEVAFDEAYVPAVVELVPDGYRLGGEAAVLCFSIRQPLQAGFPRSVARRRLRGGVGTALGGIRDNPGAKGQSGTLSKRRRIDTLLSRTSKPRIGPPI